MSNDYQPVSCQLHSEIELHAMHRDRVCIRRLDDKQKLNGIIRDVVIRDRAEYLQLETTAGELLELRLDKIAGIDAVKFSGK